MARRSAHRKARGPSQVYHLCFLPLLMKQSCVLYLNLSNSGSCRGNPCLPLRQHHLENGTEGEPGRSVDASDKEDTAGDSCGQLPHGHRHRGLHGGCNGIGAPLRIPSSPARAAVRVMTRGSAGGRWREGTPTPPHWRIEGRDRDKVPPRCRRRHCIRPL